MRDSLKLGSHGKHWNALFTRIFIADCWLKIFPKSRFHEVLKNRSPTLSADTRFIWFHIIYFSLTGYSTRSVNLPVFMATTISRLQKYQLVVDYSQTSDSSIAVGNAILDGSYICDIYRYARRAYRRPTVWGTISEYNPSISYGLIQSIIMGLCMSLV